MGDKPCSERRGWLAAIAGWRTRWNCGERFGACKIADDTSLGTKTVAADASRKKRQGEIEGGTVTAQSGRKGCEGFGSGVGRWAQAGRDV